MSCQRCKSERTAEVSAKCSDMFSAALKPGQKQIEGYVPSDLGIGGGDYVEFRFCLDCGQIQGTFPLPPAEDEAPIAEATT